MKHVELQPSELKNVGINLLVRWLSTKLRQKPLLESHKLLERSKNQKSKDT